MGLMNLMSNVLDAIPVVGHVKAAGHYLVGDTDGAMKAFYQSNRTSAVLAGGAIGSLAGPIGAAAVAAKAGIFTDYMASYFTGENHGFFKDLDNIKSDREHNRSAKKSLFIAGMHIFFDGIGGIGMDGVSCASIENIGLNLASNADEIVEKSVEELTRQIVIKKTVSESAKITVIREAGHIAVIAAKRVGVRVVKEVAETATETATKTALQTSVAFVTTHITSRGIISEDPEDDQENNANNDANPRPHLITHVTVENIPSRI